MPKITNLAIWAVSLRKSVSKLSKGWTVEEARGNVRLVIRIPEQPKQSVVLPFSDKAELKFLMRVNYLS